MNIIVSASAVAMLLVAFLAFHTAYGVMKENDGILGLLVFLFHMFVGSATGGIAFVFFVEVATRIAK